MGRLAHTGWVGIKRIRVGASTGSVPKLEPVGDRDMAELLARLVDALESGSERERGRIEQMMSALPEGGKVASPRHIVAWLGWRIIERNIDNLSARVPGAKVKRRRGTSAL